MCGAYVPSGSSPNSLPDGDQRLSGQPSCKPDRVARSRIGGIGADLLLAFGNEQGQEIEIRVHDHSFFVRMSTISAKRSPDNVFRICCIGEISRFTGTGVMTGSRPTQVLRNSDRRAAVAAGGATMKGKTFGNAAPSCIQTRASRFMRPGEMADTYQSRVSGRNQ